MKQTSRPPAQYVVAPGTRFKLVANEYDKNKYAQCGYASNRTLIRCKQIRSKEDLAKNGGRCEEHNDFSKVLEKNHKKEIQRCHAENDTNMQRRRFDPWIASNEYISDEDDFLQPMQDAPIGIPELSNDNFLDNHPLRYAGHFTEKDLLRIKMDLVQKDIDDLLEFKRLVTAQAQKEHEQLGDDKEEDRPTDMVQKRLFNASEKYSRKDYLTLTTVDPVYKPCCVGPKMDDSLVISHVLQSILDKIDNKEPVPTDEQCLRPALHLSNFCIHHIRMDRRQKLFESCKVCGAIAIGGVDPKCSQHLKQQAIAETNNCSCIKCVVPPPPAAVASPKEEKKMEPHVSDEEEALGNLSKFESFQMVSPMTPFSKPYQTSPIAQARRRYQGAPAQVLRPPNMGPPPGSVPYHPVKRPAPPLTTAQIQEQQRLKMEEEEAKSLTCSRVRPLDSSQYGSGKKKLQSQQRQQHPHRLAGSGGSPYHLPPAAKKTITPSPTASPAGKTFQGWRNQGMSSGQRMQPQGMIPHTRYPIHPNRAPPPKQIPLERIQESRDPNDSMEDREMAAPPRYHQGAPPEPQRRGVPYYRAAYRRTDLPSLQQNRHPSPLTPSTSTSSSQLLAPPQSPQGSSYRPQSRLPMAPHRAIAAGLNPADVGGMPQRPPAYRIPQQAPIRHYSPLQNQQGPLSNPNTPPHQQFHHPLANQQRPGAMQHPQQQHVKLQYGQPRVMGARPGGPPTPARSHVYSGAGAPGTPGPSNQIRPVSPELDPVGESTSDFGGADTSGSVAHDFEFANDSNVAEDPDLGSPSSHPPVLTQKSVEEAAKQAGMNAIKSLESARHDVRFSNIPVKTYLALSNQQDLGQKTQQEIEQLAAEAEQLEKRKTFGGGSGSGGSSSSSSAAPRTPVHQHQALPLPPPTITKKWGPMPRGFSPKESIPDAVQQVVATPSTGRKRKADTTSSSSEVIDVIGEPDAKKSMPDTNARTPKTPKRSTPPAIGATSGRTPRAAAVAANQAIVHHQHPKQPTPSTSAASSSSMSGAESSQENPLDLLAELSAAAEIEEEKALAAPPKTPNRKTPKKTSPTPKPSTSSSSSSATSRSGRRSSRGESLEKEQKLP